MLVLSIETCTQVSSVALYGDGGLVAEYTLGLKVTHSQRLVSAIDRILQDTGVTMADIDAVAVSFGPGSFTGVRVAVSTAKGLAYAGNIPVIPVSSLLGLACRFTGVRRAVCTLLDARRKEVYSALFRFSGGKVETVSADKAISPAALCGEIREPTLFVGEGAVKYKSLFEERIPSLCFFVPGALNYLSAASIGEIGLQYLKAGRIMDPGALVPNYIRRSEAEIHWKNGS